MSGFPHCICCGENFVMGLNVFSQDGEKETQISGTCEKCFDAMFEDMDNDSVYNYEDEGDYDAQCSF